MRLTVAQLAERIGAELVGNGSGQISAVGAVEAAGDSNITFVTNDRHIAALEKSQAGAVIVSERIKGLVKPQLIVKNVNAALIYSHRKVVLGLVQFFVAAVSAFGVCWFFSDEGITG